MTALVDRYRVALEQVRTAMDMLSRDPEGRIVLDAGGWPEGDQAMAAVSAVLAAACRHDWIDVGADGKTVEACAACGLIKGTGVRLTNFRELVAAARADGDLSRLRAAGALPRVRWECACGWEGETADLDHRADSGQRHCPGCGALGGLFAQVERGEAA